MFHVLRRRGARFPLLMTALSMFACADREVEEPAPTAKRAPVENAAYALMTEVTQDDGLISSHLSLARSVSQAEPFSLEGARPVTGRGMVVSFPKSDVFFVASGANEVLKYKVKVDGTLVPIGGLTFEPLLVGAEYASQVQLVSDTKAYYLDSRQSPRFATRMLVWNPSTMGMLDTIPLPELTVPNAVIAYSAGVVVKREGKIAIGVGWRSTQGEGVVPQSALLVIDTATDAVTILRDERCGYARDVVEGDDGRLYLATEAWGSAVHRLHPELAPAPCLLRTNPELTAFDPSFHVDLNALTGSVTGSLVQSLDGKVYTKVFDAKRAKISQATTATELVRAPVWRWAEVRLGDAPTATLLSDAQLGTGSLVVLDTDGERFVAEIEEDRSSIIDLSRGIGKVVLTTPGRTFGLTKFH